MISFFFILIESRLRPTVKYRLPFNIDTQALAPWRWDSGIQYFPPSDSGKLSVLGEKGQEAEPLYH